MPADLTTAPNAVLLIEQTPGSLDPIRFSRPDLRQAGLSFDQGDMAPDLVSRERIGLVFCDLPGDAAAGLTLLRQLRRIHPHLPIVLVLPEGARDAALEAFRQGADDVLFCPLEETRIDQVFGRVLALHEERVAAARLQERAARSLDDLVLLKAIGATTSSEENLQRLLERVVEAIQSALRVDLVSLMLGNDLGQLEIRASRGLPAEAARTRISSGEGVAGTVFARGEPVLIDDLATDGRFPQNPSPGRYRSGSLLSVPIRTQERVIGVLNVNNKRDGASFTAADQELLTMIAHQAALAIENLKLVGQIRVQTQQLEQTNAELLRLHLDRTRFVCSLSHELKTPLTSILGFADLLINFFDRFGNAEILEYLSRIHSESLHLERLISGMLRLFTLDSDRERWAWEALPLRPCLDEVLARHAVAAAELDLTVEISCAPDLEPVWADHDKLLLLLDALVENAVKFNCAGGRLQVRAENRDVNGAAHVYLAIANDGRSVPQEQAGVIFQQYSQLGDIDTDKPYGVGIGLATCKAILRRMQGWIYLEPVAGAGTCVAVLFPTHSAREEAAHVGTFPH